MSWTSTPPERTLAQAAMLERICLHHGGNVETQMVPMRGTSPNGYLFAEAQDGHRYIIRPDGLARSLGARDASLD